jgi:hypothetical protein
MATEAQIQANRANAKKSCGPKTDAGKSRSRLNSLKHSARAETLYPVLPQEDPAELAARIQEWVDDYQPTNAIERELVTRAARLSWTLDRAERHETALLARRVRKAMLRSRAKRMEKVCDLGRKLFYMAGKRLLPNSGPPWADDPSAFVARLEETPEGVRWLLDRWIEMRCLIISDELWTFHDQFRFVRLLGKQPINAIDDPELNELFLAWEVIEPEWGTRFWKHMQDLTPYEDPAFSAWRTWREIVPRPESLEAGVAFLRSIADREIERLEELLVDVEEIEGDEALELAEQASFCASDAAERLRRFQTARTRELLRTIETLTKLRKDAGRSEPTTSRKAPSEPNSRVAPIHETPAKRHGSSDRTEPAATSRKTPSEPNPLTLQTTIPTHLTHNTARLVDNDRSRSPGPRTAAFGDGGNEKGPGDLVKHPPGPGFEGAVVESRAS